MAPRTTKASTPNTAEQQSTIEDTPKHLRADVLEMQSILIARTGEPVSIAGARCALLLNQWLRGLARLPDESNVTRICWSMEGVCVSSKQGFDAVGFASHGLSSMTKLVVLAHEHEISVELCQESYSKPGMLLKLKPLTVRDTAKVRHRSLVHLRDILNERIALLEETEQSSTERNT